MVAGLSMIVLTGLGHIMVIKGEYYFGTKLWYLFLITGIICLGASLFVANAIISVVLGIAAATLLWGILELFHQRERVKKGYYPKKSTEV
ncbi:MAG: DUF4491 family protein [Elusimicrobia bacterium]|nr:DUF4491 family protein [Candidatus Liberimonas magnetica]